MNLFITWNAKVVVPIAVEMNPITIIGNLEIYIIKKKELVLRFFLFMI